jgi:hypothetical protein
MGASMRTGSSMELDFSAFIWKQLLGEHPTVRDLAGVDERLVRILEFYRTHGDAKAWAQVRQTEGGVKYMVATSDIKTVEVRTSSQDPFVFVFSLPVHALFLSSPKCIPLEGEDVGMGKLCSLVKYVRMHLRLLLK